MPRFTKLPVTIDAVRYIAPSVPGEGIPRHPLFDGDRPEWLLHALDKPPKNDGAIYLGKNRLMIGTREGLVTASPGDWIVRGTAGEVYPVKPEIFADIYRPADEAPVDASTEALTFEQELCALLNRKSMENHSNTPDFILCEFLRKSLEAFDIGITLRERWYGREAQPAPPATFTSEAARIIGEGCE